MTTPTTGTGLVAVAVVAGRPGGNRSGPMQGGCGLCVACCRSGAIRQRGFDGGQILATIDPA